MNLVSCRSPVALWPQAVRQLAMAADMASALAGCVLLAGGSLAAAVVPWDGVSNATWSNAGNWVGNALPGGQDTAMFNAPSANTTIDLGSGVTAGQIVFDSSAAAAYAIGTATETLTLADSGAISMNNSVSANQTIAAAMVLGTDATAQTYAFTNDSPSGSLTFAGSISGGSGGTAGVQTLTVGGAGNIAVNGSVSNGGAGSVALVKVGSGTMVLAAQNSYTGPTTILAGTLRLGSPPVVSIPAAAATYTFHGNVNDSSGNNNDCTTVGNPTYSSAGPLGGAINFSGSQYAYATAQGLSPISSQHISYSVSLWAKAATQPPVMSPIANGTGGYVQGPALISTDNGPTGQPGNYNFDLEYCQTSSGVFQLHGEIGNGQGWQVSGGANYTLPGVMTSWSMITYTVTDSSSGNSYAIYLNGNQVSSGTVGGAASGGNAPNFIKPKATLALGSQQAGTSSYGVGGYFNGSLANVNIYGSALSAAQIKSLYVGESAQMGQLPSTTPLSIADEATFDLNGASQTAASLADVAGAGGTVTDSAGGAVTLTLTPAGTAAFSGIIQNGNGVVGLTVNGLGTQVLAGNNTYAGATVVNSGHLIVSGAGGSTLSATTLSAGTLEVDGAWTTSTLNVTASGSLGGQGTGQLAGSGSITLTGDNLYYDSRATSDFAGTLAGSSTNAGLEVDGGTLILSGTANSYLGSTLVDAGTLIVAAGGALPNGNSLTVGAGGTFIFDPTASGTTLAGSRPAGAVAPVPEPGTMVLLSVAGIVAAAACRKRRK